jgi:hypothetical protein
MARRITEKLVQRVKETTNRCYLRAKIKVLSEAYQAVLLHVDDLIPDEEARQKIDDLYLAEINKLSSQELEDILFCHERGRMRRAPRTLESIVSELTRRVLLNDSNEKAKDNK